VHVVSAQAAVVFDHCAGEEGRVSSIRPSEG
jgi:hypothetical protein